MSLRINRLRITVSTEKGPYGTELEFKAGLNVLRAENTSGKSTCIQAILYALGLEGALGPSKSIPLTPAVTRLIQTGDGEVPVLESEVYVEIENGNGKTVTVCRPVKSQRSTDLVTVWEGAKLSIPSQPFPNRDYYVRLEGAASRESGFHSFLAQFIGWHLPEVPRFSGPPTLLYLEAIFPLFFIEQKRGWAAIQANLPTYLGIREVAKRATEFVLRLDAYEIEVRAQRLAQREVELKATWSAAVDTTASLARASGARAINLPPVPTTIWPPQDPPRLQVYRNTSWREVAETKTALLAELKQIDLEEIPKVEQVTEALSESLSSSERTLWEREEVARELLEQLHAEEAQLGGVTSRIESLQDDLKRHKDLLRLRKLGSLATLAVTTSACPTCHQHVSDSLLEQISSHPVLSVEDTIIFIENQLETFVRLKDSSQSRLESRRTQLDAMRLQLDESRAIIRSIKRSLISDGRIPSEDQIRRKLILEDQSHSLETLDEEFRVLAGRLADISTEWRDLLSEKAKLPRDGLTLQDRERLAFLEKIFVEQEIAYGFKSFDPSFFKISNENYRPTRDGYDIGFEASASDNIRVIWGYVFGLLETARKFETNHLGLLILDEPRQQEARELSFEAFVKRAAACKAALQQVIFATSEAKATMDAIVGTLDCHYLNFEGQILQKLP